MQAWLPWLGMTPTIKLYSGLWYCEYQIISVGLARQACAVADNYKEGIYARCNKISESRTMRLYKWNNRGQNNNQTLHQLTKWRKNITGSNKEVQLKTAFWGINCILHTQREQHFVMILKDLTGIYECRVYLKWTVRLEFPLSPLPLFFLERNRQTFGSLPEK